MKNIIKLVVLVPLVLVGCIKEQVPHSVKAQMKTTSDDIIIPSEDYLVELYNANDITIGLIANANLGRYPTKDDDWGINMSAPEIANIDIVLSGREFHFKKDQCVSYTGPQLLDLFGKVHDMSIKTDEEMAEYKFYIPELITAKVSNYGEKGIKRKESVLHWNQDRQYPTKVLFTYRLYTKDPMYGEVIYADAVIINDNGILDLSEILANYDAKYINFSIQRVNAIEVNTNGKRIALAFTSVDHHIYPIED